MVKRFISPVSPLASDIHSCYTLRVSENDKEVFEPRPVSVLAHTKNETGRGSLFNKGDAMNTKDAKSMNEMAGERIASLRGVVFDIRGALDNAPHLYGTNLDGIAVCEIENALDAAQEKINDALRMIDRLTRSTLPLQSKGR